MKKQILLIFSILFLGFPFITAGALDVSLVPHYYKQGVEVNPAPHVEYDSISFDVVGKNYENCRILKLEIINAYPPQLYFALPSDEQELRIQQDKVLWSSKIMDIDSFNETTVTFWVKVEGVNEVTYEDLIDETSTSITFYEPEPEVKEDTLMISIGRSISPRSPEIGIVIFFIFIIVIIYYIWDFGIVKIFKKSREENREKRRARYLEEEGWR